MFREVVLVATVGYGLSSDYLSPSQTLALLRTASLKLFFK